MARVALPQSKIKARRKRQRLILLSLAGGVFVAILLALVLLSHASFMRINAVVVSGEKTIPSAEISSRVLAGISGSYFYLFPKNNIFLYPKFKTEVDLVSALPTIAKVSVQAKDFHTLSVSVIERARKALWCGNSVRSQGPCFWLDQDGAAFAGASELSMGLSSSTSYQHYFGALQGESPPHFLTPEQFHALSALIDALGQNQINNAIQSIEVDSAGDARVTFADNFVALFSISSAGADVYERFLLVLGSNAFAGHKLSDFEYLDLRFGDKLYYKLRTNETPAKSN